MSRLLPYPLLAVSLLLMWMLLNGFTPGHFLLGLAVALFATRAMAALQPAKPRIRRWAAIPRLFGVVMLDIIHSNVAVAWAAVQPHNRGRVPGFVPIELDLRDHTGLAVLACIVTSTPGTAWVEYDSGTGVLLLHVLDLVDEQGWVETIKYRYESLLLEIFE